MRQRQLGRRGPKVSALGLGCMGMSQAYGSPDPAEGLATIHRAMDLGVNFLDTADIYGVGENEELVGRAIQGRRDEVFLASKCGLVPAEGDAPRRIDGSPEHIRAACDASLRRLGVRTIDLYYLHRVDPQTPIERSVTALSELVREGKVRHIGLSEVNAATLRRAHAVHPVTAVQSEYSLWTRDPEDVVLPACRELGVALVPFSPLGRGFFAGTLRSLEGLPAEDFRRGLPRFSEANLAHNLGAVDRLAAIARDKGCTPAQLALAWLLAQGGDIVPIPGTKRRKYLEENVGAAEVALSKSDLARIDVALPKGSAAGERYPAESMSQVQR